MAIDLFYGDRRKNKLNTRQLGLQRKCLVHALPEVAKMYHNYATPRPRKHSVKSGGGEVEVCGFMSTIVAAVFIITLFPFFWVPPSQAGVGFGLGQEAQSPGRRKFCLASGGCKLEQTRPWLDLVDLSRIPSGT